MPEPRRRAIALTPLIDVIFLLLLFFMLTTTFTRTGEIPLVAAGSGVGAADEPPLFLRVDPGGMSLNGHATTPDQLPDLLRAPPGSKRLLVSMGEGLTAQGLADVLSLLRRVPDLQAQVLGG